MFNYDLLVNSDLNLQEKCFALLCKNNQIDREKNDKPVPEGSVIATKELEWRKFWYRLGCAAPDFNGSVAVDYGCGLGYDTLIMLKNGAHHVYCLELSLNHLRRAEELHKRHGYNNVTYIHNDNVKELENKIGRDSVDIIVCRNVMEHVPSPYDVLESMHSILESGNVANIGFSPLYKSPYGSHFRRRCNVPWAHLVFSEQTVLNVFKHLYNLDKSINSYQDKKGFCINKMSIHDYLSIADSFNWNADIKRINSFPGQKWLMQLLRFLVAIAPTKYYKELFIINSYSAFRKVV